MAADKELHKIKAGARSQALCTKQALQVAMIKSSYSSNGISTIRLEAAPNPFAYLWIRDGMLAIRIDPSLQ